MPATILRRKAGIALDFLYLGKVKYLDALKLQELAVNSHISDSSKQRCIVLLLQHFPVYTIGLRSSLYNKIDEKYLTGLGADFVRIRRGGLITYHGPGQLVSYPILNLRQFGMGVRKYVENLEEVTIQLCSRHNVKAERSPHTGVWVGNNKICAIGINVQGGITSHGLALNCNTDLSWFSHIVPCGIEGKGVTSLTQCTGSLVTVEDTISLFMKCFSKIFKIDSANLKYLSDNISNEELLKHIVGDACPVISKSLDSAD